MLLRTAMALMIFAGAASAEEANIENGRYTYLYFCAECHGKDASGIGPIAEMMALEPPELTGLSDRNHGDFPTLYVATQIDGRTKAVGHGDMPIFGWSLESEKQVPIKLEDGQTLMVTEHLAALLAYLESVQAKLSKLE
jgi:mono/diheme cytochrome c family protein